MKILISHASANKEYGNALVELLRGIGLKEDEIIFTSNTAYGIPIGQNIFKWLKSQISEKPFVVYLLSKEYYSSVACLNEMGAAWIIENEHAILFTPNFDINSKEFQNGAIDPREIGFYINDEERLLSFIQHIEKDFNISKNAVIISQKLKKYLAEINSIGNQPITVIKENKNLINILESKEEIKKKAEINEPILNSLQQTESIKKSEGIYSKFLNEILAGKLKDEELILLHYIIETSRVKLLTGWQEEHEVRNIKEWEEINEINNSLSRNYNGVIRKFELRGYTEVSAVTSSGNSKEVKLKSEIEVNILDLPQEILDKVKTVVDKNPAIKIEDDFDGLPF